MDFLLHDYNITTMIKKEQNPAIAMATTITATIYTQMVIDEGMEHSAFLRQKRFCQCLLASRYYLPMQLLKT